MDAQFAKALSDRRDISWIAMRQAVNPRGDFRPRATIGQTAKPAREDFGLANLWHVRNVAYTLHCGKGTTFTYRILCAVRGIRKFRAAGT